MSVNNIEVCVKGKYFSVPALSVNGENIILTGPLYRIYSLADQFVVELKTHPVNFVEYRYLTEGEICCDIAGVRIVPPSAIPWQA